MPVDYRELATGKYYEELEPGLTFKHSITRTVSEMDNVMFSALTYNSAWLHTDEEYCKTTPYGTRIVNSMFTLALVCGVTAGDTTLGTTLGNLGFSDIRFPNPVFFGDTIYTQTEIISRRESRSMPHAGIVEFETRGTNQREEIVVTLRRTGLMLKKSSLEQV